MAKNNTKNQGNKQVQNVIDQQNEPCIKAIQKKIRNINKKIIQINQLSNKGNLKPQQIQKVNKKEKVQEEKAKYEEFLTFYKEIVVENDQLYKGFQLKELATLAEIIAVSNFATNHPQAQNQKLSQLSKIIAYPSANITLQQRADELSAVFKSFAQNNKVKEIVRKALEKNKNEPLEVTKKVSVKKQEEIVDKKEHDGHKLTKVEVAKVEVTKVEAKNQQKTSSKVDSIEEVVTKQESKNTETEKQQLKETPTENKPESKIEQKAKENEINEADEDDKKPKQPREYKKNPYPKREYKDNEKKKYKAKYEEQDNNKEEDQQENENQERDEIVRQFKREEVRKLHQDGFIVVGKPKIKGHDQKEYYQHTHGKKYHHHHNKQNY